MTKLTVSHTRQLSGQVLRGIFTELSTDTVDLFLSGIQCKKNRRRAPVQGERVIHTRFPSIEEESNSLIVKHLPCQFCISLIIKE